MPEHISIGNQGFAFEGKTVLIDTDTNKTV